MDKSEFELILDEVCQTVSTAIEVSNRNHKPSVFEDFVRKVVGTTLIRRGHPNALGPQVQGFPDIVIENFGIEVKATESDSWRCIANSVSEGKRAQSVDHIYVIYGKMGGLPQVKWADYGNSIIHVRTSHVPRFEIEIGSERSLFDTMGVSYDLFRELPMHKKMYHIRNYARGRLKEGERLWWLEDKDLDEQEHSFELSVKLFMDLNASEKRKMRAEATLLSPKVVGGGRKKRKYVDAVLYLLTYRGVLCPQARDLFSAGSVAGTERGGHYLSRAIIDIQDEMRTAAQTLEEALFVEYWDYSPQRSQVITDWLRFADDLATDWKPSEHLFLREQGKD